MCDCSCSGSSTASIKQLVAAGYTSQSAIDAVQADDLSKLRHEFPYPVQLQPPDDEDPPPAGPLAR